MYGRRSYQILLQSATYVAPQHILFDKLSIITQFSFYNSSVWTSLCICKVHICRPFNSTQGTFTQILILKERL